MAATVVARGNVSGVENKDFESLAVPLLDGLYNFARWLCSDGDEAPRSGAGNVPEGAQRLLVIPRRDKFPSVDVPDPAAIRFLTSRTGLERRNTQQENEEGFEESSISQETPEIRTDPNARTRSWCKPRFAQLAPGIPGGDPAGRSGRAEVSGDCRDPGHTDWNGDVAAGAGKKTSA